MMSRMLANDTPVLLRFKLNAPPPKNWDAEECGLVVRTLVEQALVHEIRIDRHACQVTIGVPQDDFTPDGIRALVHRLRVRVAAALEKHYEERELALQKRYEERER
jgi:hypothetical protein